MSNQCCNRSPFGSKTDIRNSRLLHGGIGKGYMFKLYVTALRRLWIPVFRLFFGKQYCINTTHRLHCLHFIVAHIHNLIKNGSASRRKNQIKEKSLCKCSQISCCPYPAGINTRKAAFTTVLNPTYPGLQAIVNASASSR